MWQFLYEGQAAPEWVLGCTEARKGKLVLVRGADKQVIEPTDWLIRNLDGKPMWSTDADFQRLYEVINE